MRDAGTTNKISRRSVASVCARKGYDPLKEIIDLIPFLPKEAQARIHMELMAYIYPKPKIQIEATGGQAPQANPLRDKTAAELIGALPITNAGTAPGPR